MKKFFVGVSFLMMAVVLVGCGSEKQSSNTVSSHSKVSQVSHKKHKHHSSKKTAVKSDMNSNHDVTESATSGNQFAKQLTDNDWYVLAYLKEWHYSISDANESPDFELSDGMIDQGTVDSECGLISISAATVTVAPSSGEGAWSTFPHVTLSKADLLKQFINSQDDVSLVAALSAKAVSKADSYSDDSDDDTNDDDDEDTNDDNDDEDTNDDDTDSNDDTTDDQDTDSQDDDSTDDQDTDTQDDDDESTDDDSTADNEAWQVVTPAMLNQQTDSVIKL